MAYQIVFDEERKAADARVEARGRAAAKAETARQDWHC